MDREHISKNGRQWRVDLLYQGHRKIVNVPTLGEAKKVRDQLISFRDSLKNKSLEEWKIYDWKENL